MTSTNRRHFIQSMGLGLAAAATGVHSTRANQNPADDKSCCTAASPVKLGLASYSTRKYNLDDTIAITKRVGLKHICLKSMHLPYESSPDEIKAITQKVCDAGLDLYGAGVVGLKSTDEIDKRFEYARLAGMRVLVTVPAWEHLDYINDKIKEYDIAVAIHNHGPEDKQIPTPNVAYEKIKHLDPRFGLCMDIGHTLRAGVDPAAAARQFADRLLDIHLKDIDKAAPDGQKIEVGRGVINFKEFFTALIDIRFAGIVSYEYEKDPEDILPGLAESVGYCRGVLAAI